MIPRRVLSLLPVPLLMALAACSPPADRVARGRAHFTSFACVRCHAIGDQGARYGPDLTTIGFRKSAEWLDLWLKNPHGWKAATVMPNMHLPEHVRGDLVAFLTEQKGQLYATAGKPWERPEDAADPVKKGEAAFRRIGCTGCHGRGGIGGNPNNNVAGGVIPGLIDVAEKYSHEELEDKIRQGSIPAAADRKKPAPMIVMPEWGKLLSESDLDALASYLLTLKSKKKKGSEDW